MFKAMDTDHSGAITFDELKAGLRKFGFTLKDTEIRDLMDAVRLLSIWPLSDNWPKLTLCEQQLNVISFQADVDNSGTIDYGEFVAATVHLNKLDREEHLVAAFWFWQGWKWLHHGCLFL